MNHKEAYKHLITEEEKYVCPVENSINSIHVPVDGDSIHVLGKRSIKAHKEKAMAKSLHWCNTKFERTEISCVQQSKKERQSQVEADNIVAKGTKGRRYISKF